MKKITSFLLTIVLSLSFAISVFAVDDGNPYGYSRISKPITHNQQLVDDGDPF